MARLVELPLLRDIREKKKKKKWSLIPFTPSLTPSFLVFVFVYVPRHIEDVLLSFLLTAVS